MIHGDEIGFIAWEDLDYGDCLYLLEESLKRLENLDAEQAKKDRPVPPAYFAPMGLFSAIERDRLGQ